MACARLRDAGDRSNSRDDAVSCPGPRIYAFGWKGLRGPRSGVPCARRLSARRGMRGHEPEDAAPGVGGLGRELHRLAVEEAVRCTRVGV